VEIPKQAPEWEGVKGRGNGGKEGYMLDLYPAQAFMLGKVRVILNDSKYPLVLLAGKKGKFTMLVWCRSRALLRQIVYAD
jgi:hypothetical protein